MTVEEAAELARRAIYHATFRDGASGGVASGNSSSSFSLFYPCLRFFFTQSSCSSVYHVGPDGWKKLSGDDVGDLHYHYYPVVPSPVEQEMVEIPAS